MRNEPHIVRVAVNTAIFSVDRLYDYKSATPLEPGQRVLVPFGRGNRPTEAIVLAVCGQTGQKKLKSVERVLDDSPVIDEPGLRLALWMNSRFYCTVYEAIRAMLPIGLWFTQSETVALEQPFSPEQAWPLVSHDPELTRGLELLTQSKGEVPLTEWQLVMGAKWQSVLRTLLSLGLARRVTQSKRRLKGKVERIARLAQSSEEIQAIADTLPRSSAARRDILNLLLTIEAAPADELLLLTQASPRILNKLVRDGMVIITQQEPLAPENETAAVTGQIMLNETQENAYIGIHSLLDTRQAACALLFGVTGSGKTSVYIRLLQDVVAQGGQAIVLVPEIALTPQLIGVFSSYFRAAVVHSAMDAGERLETWNTIKSGQIDVVIGTRSAVFAPLPSLRMIILDEEQEHTYKSENAPRYHARDVAKFRCVQHGALLLLGSATPSVESMYSASKNSYAFFELSHRYNESPLPSVIMADLRRELRNGNDSTISSVLRDEITANLSAGEQTILFLNRRGYQRLVTCTACGQVRQCPNCSVSLTYHAHNQRMVCHYCGYSEPKESRCAGCGGELLFFGAGTQKVVCDLAELFPDVEVMRMDTDTTSHKGAHKTLLTRFAEKNIPILVGTQMITKGLNLNNVTLVGVVSADMSLYVDDYRANERTFGLITQVIGRAGRGVKPGRAVIQTFSPSHPVLLQAAEQDYRSFFENEIALREQQGYPPYGEMIMLNCFGGDQDVLIRACLRLRGRIDRGVRELGLKVRVVGPAPAVVHKINNRFRYHITLCGSQDVTVRRFVASVLRQFPKDRANKGVVVYADLNPCGF